MSMAPAETLPVTALRGSRYLRRLFAGGATFLPRGVRGSKKRGNGTGGARADTSVLHLPTCRTIRRGSSAAECVGSNTREVGGSNPSRANPSNSRSRWVRKRGCLVLPTTEPYACSSVAERPGQGTGVSEGSNPSGRARSSGAHRPTPRRRSHSCRRTHWGTAP